MPASITLTNKTPESPKADLAFYIDFKKGEGSASRVFSATSDFIKACERLDRNLVTSIDANIETVMMLEDIEAGSLKTWLRNVISATDDQSLKTLDWKSIVGNYLVSAKYCVLKWINKEDQEDKSLLSLSRDIKALAVKTDVRHIPDYMPVEPSALMQTIKDLENVKDHFAKGDKASVIIPNKEEIELKLPSQLNIEAIEVLSVRETKSHLIPSMICIVKKPDYLGSSMWELRHGKQNILAKIEDEKWIKEFQSRKVNVRPGDALECRVRIDVLYGYDNEIFKTKYYIEEVLQVHENQYQIQSTLFDTE